MELESSKQQILVKNQYIVMLKLHLLTNQKPMKQFMFQKLENGNFRNYMEPKIRSLIPRPSHFGPIKCYVNGRLDRKWRRKYWELWYIQSGELIVKFEYLNFIVFIILHL